MDKTLLTDSDVLSQLLRVYSLDQLVRLARYSHALADEGFGKVSVTFSNGHPRFLEIMQSQEFPQS